MVAEKHYPLPNYAYIHYLVFGNVRQVLMSDILSVWRNVVSQSCFGRTFILPDYHSTSIRNAANKQKISYWRQGSNSDDVSEHNKIVFLCTGTIKLFPSIHPPRHGDYLARHA